MAEVYTIRDAIKKSKILDIEDGYTIYCDSYHHYRAGPEDVDHLCTCDCHGLALKSPAPARPRYEVYNKDGDYFWDHKLGVMFGLITTVDNRRIDRTPLIDLMVEQIVKLLNMDDCKETILAHEASKIECQ